MPSGKCIKLNIYQWIGITGYKRGSFNFDWKFFKRFVLDEIINCRSLSERRCPARFSSWSFIFFLFDSHYWFNWKCELICEAFCRWCICHSIRIPTSTLNKSSGKLSWIKTSDNKIQKAQKEPRTWDQKEPRTSESA